MADIERRVNGRPTLWNDQFLTIVFEMALLGATDVVLARALNVDIKTIEYWKRTKPEFVETLKRGKDEADAKVAASLYMASCGYERDEEIVHVVRGEVIRTTIRKYYPPNVWAAARWMSLRQRAIWGDVQRIENTQTHININKFDFGNLSTEELELVKKVGLKSIAENIKDSE